MDRSASKSTDSMTALVGNIHRVVLHRRRLKAVLPEDVAKVKSQLKVLDAGEIGVDNYDLLFGIGILLNNRREGLTMSEVSRALSVPTSTATRMVDSLVRAGYMARNSDAEDRRIVRVVMTPAGQTVFNMANNFLRKRATWMLRHFTPTEQTQLVKLLGKLADALDEEMALAHEGDK